MILKNGSHLLQMRGLKPKPPVNRKSVIPVASFTDAWIETMLAAGYDGAAGRIFYRCVD